MTGDRMTGPQKMDEAQPKDHRGASLPSSAAGAGEQPGRIPPEVVRQVADQVYGMLLRSLKIEAERERTSQPNRERGYYVGQ